MTWLITVLGRLWSPPRPRAIALGPPSARPGPGQLQAITDALSCLDRGPALHARYTLVLTRSGRDPNAASAILYVGAVGDPEP